MSYLPQLASNFDPSNYRLPSSCDYRYETQGPSYFHVVFKNLDSAYKRKHAIFAFLSLTYFA
jgi:hypothetical protein